MTAILLFHVETKMQTKQKLGRKEVGGVVRTNPPVSLMIDLFYFSIHTKINSTNNNSEYLLKPKTMDGNVLRGWGN